MSAQDELDKLYNEAMAATPSLQGTFALAEPDDLGIDDELEKFEIYDYEQDMHEALVEGIETVDHMASLYLNGNQELVEHPYIKKKRLYDAVNQADMMFVQKMAKKALVMQAKQIDMGDATPRHYETFYAGLREVRENIKQLTTTQQQMEGFYKMLRTDLGMSETIETNVPIEEEVSKKDEVFDPKKFDTKMAEMMKQMLAQQEAKSKK